MAWTMFPSLTLQRATIVAVTATDAATIVLKREPWAFSTASRTVSPISLMRAYSTQNRGPLLKGRATVGTENWAHPSAEVAIARRAPPVVERKRYRRADEDQIEGDAKVPGQPRDLRDEPLGSVRGGRDGHQKKRD